MATTSDIHSLSEQIFTEKYPTVSNTKDNGYNVLDLTNYIPATATVQRYMSLISASYETTALWNDSIVQWYHDTRMTYETNKCHFILKFVDTTGTWYVVGQTENNAKAYILTQAQTTGTGITNLNPADIPYPLDNLDYNHTRIEALEAKIPDTSNFALKSEIPDTSDFTTTSTVQYLIDITVSAMFLPSVPTIRQSTTVDLDLTNYCDSGRIDKFYFSDLTGAVVEYQPLPNTLNNTTHMLSFTPPAEYYQEEHYCHFIVIVDRGNDGLCYIFGQAVNGRPTYVFTANQWNTYVNYQGSTPINPAEIPYPILPSLHNIIQLA